MSDDHRDPSAAVRDATNGRFLRGPGRRVGSRNRVSLALAMAVLEDFAANLEKVLKQLRYSHLRTYAALVSRLLPRGGELEAEEGDPDTLPPLQAAAAKPAAPPRAEIDRALNRLESQLLAQVLAHEREAER